MINIYDQIPLLDFSICSYILLDKILEYTDCFEGVWVTEYFPVYFIILIILSNMSNSYFINSLPGSIVIIVRGIILFFSLLDFYNGNTFWPTIFLFHDSLFVS